MPEISPRAHVDTVLYNLLFLFPEHNLHQSAHARNFTRCKTPSNALLKLSFVKRSLRGVVYRPISVSSAPPLLNYTSCPLNRTLVFEQKFHIDAVRCFVLSKLQPRALTKISNETDTVLYCSMRSCLSLCRIQRQRSVMLQSLFPLLGRSGPTFESLSFVLRLFFRMSVTCRAGFISSLIIAWIFVSRRESVGVFAQVLVS